LALCAQVLELLPFMPQPAVRAFQVCQEHAGTNAENLKN
jgi:hypothetical protein